MREPGRPTHPSSELRSTPRVRRFTCEVCGKPATCSIRYCDGYCAPVHAGCLEAWRRNG